MQERAAAHQGHIDFIGNEETGTEVEVFIPVQPPVEISQC
jgi:signal transduction histidine kinase